MVNLAGAAPERQTAAGEIQIDFRAAVGLGLATYLVLLMNIKIIGFPQFRLATFGLLATLLASPLPAQLTFTFTYTDVVLANGLGYADATLGATRRSALESAASTLAGYFTGYNVSVGFTVTSENTNSSTLASAGSGVSFSGNGFYKSNVQKLIQTSTGTSDGTINWNFFHNWDYDDSIAGGAYDYKSTAMHEVLHAMGFLSGINATGQGLTTQTSGMGDVWYDFDRFLTNSAGTFLVNSGTFAFNTGLLSTLTGGSAAGVFFSGANALAAYSSNRVQIYSPNPYQSGSSGSHTDDDTFTGGNQLLMNAASTTGQGLRTLSAIELGVLTDLGYNVTAVPEPATYVLLLGLVSLTVVVLRRRRQLV